MSEMTEKDAKKMLEDISGFIERTTKMISDINIKLENQAIDITSIKIKLKKTQGLTI